MILSELNYWAILVSGIAYWMIGSFWFSVLMRKTWSIELELLGLKIKKPNTKQLTTKMIGTFILNTLSAFGVSIILHLTRINTAIPAIWMGLALGIFFAAAAMWTAYIWENRSVKLSLIDAGYPIIGITVCSLILALWY